LKILFVSREKQIFGVSPITKNQGESLIKKGIFVEFYTIKGKGIFGYIKNIYKLRNHIKKKTCDLIHAHYYLSAIIASLAKKKNSHNCIING
jgi:hypothetical protein